MVIDTSAIVAILENEPEGPGFVRLIAADEVWLLSAVSRVECTCVIEGRKRAAGRADLELFLREAGVELAAVTADQAEIACEAFRRFGRGRHPVGLSEPRHDAPDRKPRADHPGPLPAAARQTKPTQES